MSDFMAVVPLFCKDLRASLYKPFFIKFYPLCYSPGVRSIWQLWHCRKFAYPFHTHSFFCLFFFPLSIRRVPSLFFCLLNSLFSLNKAFFVYDGFSLLFSFLFKPSAYIELSCRHSPKRLFLWLRWGEIYRKNKPSLLIKLYPSTPAYKFPSRSNN